MEGGVRLVEVGEKKRGGVRGKRGEGGGGEEKKGGGREKKKGMGGFG